LLKRAVIFANGELTDLQATRAVIQPDALLIAADGGAEHCRALGLKPHALIGDLDSASPQHVAALEATGTRIFRYPARKNETDLELALDYAIAQNATDILILGGLGGRWDQTLANLLLPFRATSGGSGDPPRAWPSIRLLDGNQEIIALRGPAAIHIGGGPGDLVSLIPIGGDARGLTTIGLEYPLHAETLTFGATRGISNVMTRSQASVSLAEGFLICVVINQNTTANLGR